MDFMKVFDQTVREIKREVNIKVLKVPEIEQKVLDATSNEAWGPHGSDLAELAKATKRFTDCQLVMNVLWTRLADGGRNWRHVYKALAVIEYLIANGSEKAVDDIIEHTSQISSLSGFEYVEPNGKDVGINVRKKSETIISLLSNKDKIQEVRNKAAANRDKYFGLSSTGVTYKSSSASSSFGSSNFPSKDHYGGFGAKKEGEIFKDSYRDGELQDDDVSKDSREKSRRGFAIEDDEHNMKTSTRYGSRNQGASASNATKTSAKLNNSNDYGTIPSQNPGALDGPEDDFDDFDPRGSSTTGASPAAATVNEVDLFGNFMDEPVVAPMSVQNSNTTADEVDLFVDATFVSAAPHVDAEPNFQTQDTVDLFGSQPTFSSASSAKVDFFTVPGPVLQTDDMHPPPPQNEGINSHTADPFASVPLNTFDGSDLFGAFTSQTDQVSAEPLYSSTNQGNVNSRNPSSAMEVKPQSKKDAFQVKSGIWADSLSRGIIDLNITAPKRTNLADIGIVGGLSDVAEEKEKVLPSSGFMGRAMGTGSGLGRSGFNPSTGADNGDDVFSTLRHQQGFGNLRK